MRSLQFVAKYLRVIRCSINLNLRLVGPAHMLLEAHAEKTKRKTDSTHWLLSRTSARSEALKITLSQPSWYKP